MEEQHNTTVRDQEYSDSATQRTIIDLIDVESGEFVDANMLDTMTEAELTRLKELQSIAKKSGKYKYVCAVCGQPLRLDSRQFASKRYKSYFFSHYSNGDDCPLKSTYDAIDPIRSTINWYRHFKESNLHKDMCQKLMQVFAIDKRFSEISSYPTISIYGEDVHWHKPDVAANFYGYQLVFETLMYNTFLSSVIDKDSFYRMANSFLIWIFPHFSIDNQKMCEKDVYYTHKRNIFVFDSEDYYRSNTEQDSSKPLKPAFVGNGYLYAQEESLKRGRFMLNCFWQTPVVSNNGIKIEWHHKLVSIEELTFDATRKDVFFHNCDYDFKEVADDHKRKLIEDWERAKEERWSQVFQGIRERKERYEHAQCKKIARENEQNVFSMVLAGEVIPEPFVSDGKYGYKVDDTVIIKPQYGKAFPFRNGFAIVINKRGKRGLINLRNERIINIDYDVLSWIDQENPVLLACGSRGNFHIYNTNGEKVISYTLRGYKNANGNYIIAKASDSSYGIMSPDGKVILEPLFDKIEPKDENKYVLRYAGRTKTIPSHIGEIQTKIIEELSSGKYLAERLLYYGIVDDNGHSILPFEYSKIKKISSRYILIEKINSHYKDYGLMDYSLNLVMPMDIHSIAVLSNGYFIRNGTLYDSNLTVVLEGYDSIEQSPDGCYILSQRISLGWFKSAITYGLADESGHILFPCFATKKIVNKEGNADFHSKILKNGNIVKTCFRICSLFDAEGNRLSKKEYSKMKPLPNGHLLVEINKKKGVIDENGNEIVECNYDQLDFNESGEISTTILPLDKYCQKQILLGKCALASVDSICLTDYIYNDIKPLVEGIYIATEQNGHLLLDKSGKTIFSTYDIYKFEPLGKNLILIGKGFLYGAINLDGSLVVPCEFSSLELQRNGNIKVTNDGYGNQLYGMYKPDGTIIAECRYPELHTDEDGNICPYYRPLDEDNFSVYLLDKCALANKDKVLLTEFIYNSIDVFDESLYLVTSEFKNGLIDKTGQIVLSLIDEDIVERLTEDRFLIQNKYRRNIGIVGANGSTIVPVIYNDIVKLPNNTWKVIKSDYRNTKYGIFGYNGEVIHECIYHELETDENGNVIPIFSGNDNTIFAARMFDKFALCNDKRQILTDYLYDQINYIGDGFYIVQSSSKQGVIDILGQEVLPMIDYNIKTVVNRNHFIIQERDYCGIVNKEGSVITKETYYDLSPLPNGFIIGRRYNTDVDGNSIYDLINEDGNIVFTSNSRIKLDENSEPIITTVLDLGDVSVKRCSGKYALCFGDRTQLADFIYDSIEQQNEAMFKVSKNKKYGLVDIRGRVILPTEYSQEFENYSLGVVKFCKKENWEKHYGLCDSAGNILAESAYTYIRENSPGHFKLFYMEGNERKSKFLSLQERKEFEVGHIYSGKISGIQDYGVFVKVYGYGSGLIHRKNLKSKGKDTKSFSIGDTVSVIVCNIRKDGKIEFTLQ